MSNLSKVLGVLMGSLVAACASSADDTGASQGAISGTVGGEHDSAAAAASASAAAQRRQNEQSLLGDLVTAYRAEDTAMFDEQTPGRGRNPDLMCVAGGAATALKAALPPGARVFTWNLVDSAASHALGDPAGATVGLKKAEPMQKVTADLEALGYGHVLTYVERPSGANVELYFLAQTGTMFCPLIKPLAVAVQCVVPQSDKSSPRPDQCSLMRP
jgi:hypothetical protein